MKKITLTLLTFIAVTCSWQIGAQTFPGNPIAAIPDNTPAGTSATAAVAGLPSASALSDITVNLSINHTWAGDLTFELEAPTGETITLFFEPGSVGGIGAGDSSDFTSAAPIDFSDAYVDNAENMGNTILGTEFICQTDGRCTYFPASDDGTQNLFSDFIATLVTNGSDPNGNWSLNVADTAGGDTGNVPAWSITFTTSVVGPITECGNAPENIPNGAPGVSSGLMNPSIANVTATGIIGVDYLIDNVTLNIQHTWADDLEIVLVSPAGTRLALCTDNGGSTGLDTAADLVFTDVSTNNITTWNTGVPIAADYRAEGGANVFPVLFSDDPGVDMNTVFDGESVNGNWTIEINDDAGGDFGILNSYCITFDPNVVIGNPPVISCPADINASNAAGQCGATANFAAVAIDPEDGNISGSIVYTPASGSFFPVGSTEVTATITDSDGNSDSCSFFVNITDDEDPVVACQDITVELDANGDYNLTPAEAIASATDNCGIASIEFADPLNSDFTECGPSGLLIPATGTSGPMDPSPAVVTTVGTVGVDYAIDKVDLDLNHTFDGDLNITLTSPNGLVLDLSSGNGGSGDNYTNTVFMDGFPSITTGTAPFTGTFQPEGGPMNGFFAGEPVNGNWTLNITDLFGGDSGVLNNYCITFTSLAPATVPSIDLTCANVGTNTFTVVVTDVNGNTSTCETEVTVEDNTDPVIACIGEPAPVTDNVNDSPNVAIPDNDTNGVSVTIDITDDFVITDLDVDLDVTHTWVGDIDVTLESPSGTQVIIMDRPGVPASTFGCDGNDILATLDDEAALPIEDECGGGVPTISGTFIPNNPLSAFDGESTLGTWTLTVRDNAGGDTGTLNSWGLSYTYDVTPAPYDAILDGTTGTVTVNAADLLLNVDEACGYTVSFGVAGSPINECGDGLPAAIDENLPPTESTATIAESGIVGTDYAIESVTLDITHTFDGDLDIELVSPTGTVLMLSDQNGGSGDNYTGTVFQDGGADITAASAPFTGTFQPQGGTFAATFGGEQINGGWVLRVTDNFGGDVGTLDTYCINFTPLATSTIEFDCSQLGLNQVDVTVTDPSGNTATCTATVNVIDNTDPILVCMDATVELDENGMAEVTPDLFIDTVNSFDACGITITAVDVTDVTCDDIGTAITVTVFASDASGNLASCTATLTVIDALGPMIEGCPEDQTVDPGPLNLFYELPDYWALGGITAVDNCTDPVTIFSQNPPAGTLLPDGTYTIAICATDEYGNEGCCTFQLTVESLLGNEDIALDNAIAMYPNPTDGQVTIANTSNIQLEKAVIYDANGRLVQQVDLRGMTTERTFNVSSLASGVYMVQIQSQDAQTVKRLIRR